MGHPKDRKKDLGQFFTPPRLAEWILETIRYISPAGRSMLDPACGEGVFLVAAWKNGFRELIGIDVDAAVIRECRRHLRGIPDVRLICADALGLLHRLEGRFDLVATNPPFAAWRGRVRDPATLAKFELGAGRRSEASEVLFLELAVRSLRDGGMLAIILPDGILSSIPNQRVREWLVRNVSPIAIISLSRRFFRAKSGVLIARRGASSDGDSVFIAHAEREEDLADISRVFREGRGIWRRVPEMVKDMSPLRHLRQSVPRSVFPMIPLREVVREIRSGIFIRPAPDARACGKRRWLGPGMIRELWIDPSRDPRGVEADVRAINPKRMARKGDVLFVRVGRGCIGRAAVVLGNDEEGIPSDYFYILRFDPRRMLPEFFVWLTGTGLFRDQLDTVRRGTGTETVPVRLLREIQIPIPPIAIQMKFAAAYRRLRRRMREGKLQREKVEVWIRLLESILDGREANTGGSINDQKSDNSCASYGTTRRTFLSDAVSR